MLASIKPALGQCLVAGRDCISTGDRITTQCDNRVTFRMTTPVKSLFIQVLANYAAVQISQKGSNCLLFKQEVTALWIFRAECSRSCPVYNHSALPLIVLLFVLFKGKVLYRRHEAKGSYLPL